MPLLGGPSDLSAKRTSENLNILCVSCFASQRSFLLKTNNLPSVLFLLWLCSSRYTVIHMLLGCCLNLLLKVFTDLPAGGALFKSGFLCVQYSTFVSTFWLFYLLKKTCCKVHSGYNADLGWSYFFWADHGSFWPYSCTLHCLDDLLWMFNYCHCSLVCSFVLTVHLFTVVLLFGVLINMLFKCYGNWLLFMCSIGEIVVIWDYDENYFHFSVESLCILIGYFSFADGFVEFMCCCSGQYSLMDLSSLPREGIICKIHYRKLRMTLSYFLFISKAFWILVFKAVLVPEAMYTISIAEHSFNDFFFLNMVMHWLYSLLQRLDRNMTELATKWNMWL